ncbi:MAG TPA: Hsp33 family molecular chaperone HslO [Bacillota bacterium]|nr:Hsp33 family molecular chaperone HslO [Bacillota bacterium]
MPDQILRALAYDNLVRVYVGTTTSLVEASRAIHDTWPTATAALGRALTAAALMATMRDTEERLTLQIMGGGPVGRIVTVATGTGEVKGYMDEPHVDLELNRLGKLDVSGAVGKEGNLYIIRDIGMREPYRGIVRLVSGEIGEDIAHYFLSSEQTRSAVALGVKVDPTGNVLGAGGYIIQLMPGADEKLAAELEKNLTSVPDISTLVANGENEKAILERLVGDGQPSNLETIPLYLTCHCDREKFIGPLISLGVDELISMAEEVHDTELVCHFCRSTYYFSPEELRAMAKQASAKNISENHLEAE